MTQGAGRLGPVGRLAAVGVALLAVSAAALPPVAAVDAPLSAVLRVEIDGFRYLDGSRDSVLHTTGWCPGGDERLTLLGCDIDQTAGSAALHTGMLGFGALRRVSPAPPPESGVSRRLLVVDAFPDRTGALEVAVDAAAAGGVAFTLVDGSAFPQPAEESAQRVVWAADSDGSGQHTFAVAYDTDLGGGGAADAVPSVTVTLDHGQGGVAAEHLRGAVLAPSGAAVARVSELVYAARVVGAVGQPQLDGGEFVSSVGPAGMVQASNRNQVTALGHAPPLSFDTDRVTVEHVQPGPRGQAASLSWRTNTPSDSVYAGLGVENSPLGEQPTWLRVFAALEVRGDSGRGLVDGEAVRATYHVNAITEPLFRPGDEEPRNDDGRLVFDWDGRIFDEVGFLDSYGHLARRYAVKWGSAPPFYKAGVGDGDAYEWLQSMWTVQMRVEGGDIDRRDHDSTIVEVEGVSVSSAGEPDGGMRLDVPDDGWQIWRIVIGDFITSAGPRTQDLSEWNDDGSVTYQRRVRDGHYWLESELGPDGAYTWAWPLALRTDAWRWDGNGVRPPRPPEAIDTHVVPDGEQLEVQVLTRDGGHDRLVLGPGIHQVRIAPDGTIQLLDRQAAQLAWISGKWSGRSADLGVPIARGCSGVC